MNHSQQYLIKPKIKIKKYLKSSFLFSFQFRIIVDVPFTKIVDSPGVRGISVVQKWTARYPQLC